MTAIITYGKTLRSCKSLKQGTGNETTQQQGQEPMKVVTGQGQPCEKQQEVVSGLLCMRQEHDDSAFPVGHLPHPPLTRGYAPAQPQPVVFPFRNFSPLENLNYKIKKQTLFWLLCLIKTCNIHSYFSKKKIKSCKIGMVSNQIIIISQVSFRPFLLQRHLLSFHKGCLQPSEAFHCNRQLAAGGHTWSRY